MTEPEIILPHPKQRQLISCPANEILYGGAAGGGKTAGIGFDWCAHHARYGGDAKGLVLRRTNSELEDMIRNLQNMFMRLPDKPEWKEAKRIFLYRDGAVLEMGYLESYEDVQRYVGREFNWLAWDELTLWPDPDAYEFLMTRMRSAKGVPSRVLATTNPGGPGHNWVMKRWKIDDYPDGNRTFKDVTKLPNGQERVWTRVFIKSLLSDNPSLDTDGDYRSRLMQRSEHIRKMLLDGRWDVLEGAFFPEWDPSVHVIPPHSVPPTAKKWMAMDWGTTKPYAAVWLYEAGNGDVIVYDELYGCVEGKTNVGTRENASLVAQRIRQREREKDHYVTERYLDIECWSNDGHDVSVAGLFAKEGVHFLKAIKRKKGEGIENLREYLKVVNGYSRLKVMSHCRNLIRTLPMLQIDKNKPDQYDSDGEDHAADCALYLVRRNTPTSDQLKNKNRSFANRNRLQSQTGPYGLY